MRSTSKSKKAQFYIVTAVFIVIVMYQISSWISSMRISKTSYVLLEDEFGIFDNIKEKSIKTVRISSCEELRWNLDEYKYFVEKFGLENNMKIDLEYTIQKCDLSGKKVNFTLSLQSPSIYMNSTFDVTI